MSPGLLCGSNDLAEGMVYGLPFLKHAPRVSSSAKHSSVLSKKYEKGRGLPVARIVWKILVFNKLKKVSFWQDFSEPLLRSYALQISPRHVDYAASSNMWTLESVFRGWGSQQAGRKAFRGRLTWGGGNPFGLAEGEPTERTEGGAGQAPAARSAPGQEQIQGRQPWSCPEAGNLPSSRLGVSQEPGRDVIVAIIRQ